MNKKVAIILVLCSIAFAPALRSCGHISYGFPAVAIEAKDPITITNLKPINALINIVIIAIIFFLIKKFMLNNDFSRVFKDGLKGIYLYQLILFFSYFVLYWFIQISDKFLLMLYVLYPFSTNILDLKEPLLGTISENSRFFGDELDITVRLNYLSSLLLWFLAAIIIARLKSLYTKKKINNF